MVTAKPNPPPLKSSVLQTIVLAYQENPEPLVKALHQEGLNPTVQRAVYNEIELKLPRNSRTFLNHRQAWERAASSEGYTLVCESDFVPCQGLGSFPVFWPVEDAGAWGYLYQGSPRLFAVVGRERWLRGHCAPLVAYIINPAVARMLLAFFDQEIKQRPLAQYSTFDAHVQWSVMKMGGRAYIPLKHYGEHGGGPNKEHAALGGISRAGEHHADNLQAPLHFLPQYAKKSSLLYYKVRLFNRILGLLRLVSGRWIMATDVYPLSRRARVEMFLTGIRRLVP